MHEVTVNKYNLLEKLKENREQHQADFVEAIHGYKEKLAEAFRYRLAELEAGRIPDQSPNMPRPEKHTAEYDQVIMMVEMSVEKELKLSSQEFAQFVMDNWSWKKHFTNTAAMYSS